MSKRVKRQKYLVAYTITGGGHGRIFMTADAKFPMCENMILAFEKNLREEHGQPNPIVHNVVPLETLYEEPVT